MWQVAVYRFPDYDDWQAAKKGLEKIFPLDNFTSESSFPFYYIIIYQNCDDLKTAGKICSENGGHYELPHPIRSWSLDG